MLNETILNIFQNYVPSKYITVNDKDLVSMNQNMKSKIKARNLLYKQHIQNGRFESDFALFETFITELNELISSTKNLYSENLGKN